MKRIKVFLISLLMIFGVSCTYSHAYIYTKNPSPKSTATIIEVKIDQGFNDEDRIEIQQALSQWNYVLNGHYYLTVVDWNYDASELRSGEIKYDDELYKDSFYFVKIDSQQLSKFSVRGKPGDFVLGFAPIGGTMLFVVRDRLTTGDVYYVIMHEVAHMLGADHNGFRLMSPSLSHVDYRCVDEKTALQITNYLGLALSDLNWCHLD